MSVDGMCSKMGYCDGPILLRRCEVRYNELVMSPSTGVATGVVTGIRLLVVMVLQRVLRAVMMGVQV